MVKYINTFSEARPVRYGVPQGSILGPLLFVICINDFSKYLEGGQSYLYADDTAILVRAKSFRELEYKLNAQLDLVSRRLNKNKLTLNAHKTNFMIFGSQNNLRNIRQINVQVVCETIERAMEVKYSGNKLGLKLNFKVHVSYIQSKVIPRLKMLPKVWSACTQNTSLMLCKTLIAPVIILQKSTSI